MQRYKATNVAGLMADESVKVFLFLSEKGSGIITNDEIAACLPVKSDNSRKRIFQELQRRYQQIKPEIFDYFLTAERAEKNIIIFYASLKLYKLLFDVVFQILIPKYKNGQGIVTRTDIFTLLDNNTEQQEQIEKWSLRSRKNVASIILMILGETNIQNSEKIKPLAASDALWKLFVSAGEQWMLKVALLPLNKRMEILKQYNGN